MALPNLLVELIGQGFLLFVLPGALIRKDVRQALQELGFPLGEQVGMDLCLAGDLGERCRV